MSNILLVGATGNIGGATADALRNKGVDFSVLVRDRDKSNRWRDAGIEQVEGDVRDATSLGKAFDGFDAILSVSPLGTDIDRTGADMVAAAQATGIKQFVRCSALGAAPDAAITMGRLHWEAESALLNSNLNHTILRPASFMQNYLRMAESIRSESVFRSPLGEGRVSLIDVRDLGEIAAAALTEPGHAGRTYSLTGPEAISCADMAARLTDKLGREVRYVEVSEEQANSAMRQAGMPAPVADMVAELNAISKAGYLAEISPDTEQALGHRPRTFADFLDANATTFGG